MPLRSLMYFFIFDATIRMSRSTLLESAGPEEETCAGAGGAATTLRGAAAGAGAGAGSGDALAIGARSSTAQASRWFASARCASQQATLQNTSRMRFRLHVDTLHTQCFWP